MKRILVLGLSILSLPTLATSFYKYQKQLDAKSGTEVRSMFIK